MSILRRKYIILTATTPEHLTAVTQKQLDKGWSLSGSAFFGVDSGGSGLFCQPMTTNEVRTGKEK